MVQSSRSVNENQGFPSVEEFMIKWKLIAPDERDAWREEFLRDHPHLEERIEKALAKAELIEMNRDLLPEESKEEIFSLITGRIDRHERKKRWLVACSSVAALLLIGFFSITFLRLHTADRLTRAARAAAVAPAEDSATTEVQIISGGQKISIANNADLQVTSSARVVVTDTASARQEVVLDPVSINSLIVPYGRSTTMTLADGTRIWLNAGTRLDFPSRFTGGKREIWLTGEIYLEVAKDSLMPFIVNTGKLAVEVLGTAFNVSAYEQDAAHTVVLVSGNVSVHAGEESAGLLPGEKAEITNGTIATGKVDVDEYTSWTRGILVFNSTPISEVLRKIGRYYNLSFEISPDLAIAEKNWSGKLFLSDNPGNVLASVAAVLSVTYTLDNGTVYLNKKTESL